MGGLLLEHGRGMIERGEYGHGTRQLYYIEQTHSSQMTYLVSEVLGDSKITYLLCKRALRKITVC
jgi:hypothetical protein